MPRGDFPLNTLNDDRFINIDKLPKVLTTVKFDKTVEFHKQMERDEKTMYNLKMSETCHSAKLMDRIRPE